ncbi:SCAN domain-containing protein 3 [Nephila pilipes]|uniref:SCAN domain-containing protein 3 n=1 Tax=Nephila pilipes TaxID=299642 RepID=A0A8X6UHS9_NEPPI|nr:SCAN domain-containing protein 3 [Nephila pilipes]
MDKFLRRKDSSSRTDDEEPSTSVTKNLKKKPHTVGETLIIPPCMEIVRLMLGPNEVKEVNKVSLSADTVKRRIHDMSSDILGALIKKLLSAEKFALQIDETTDIKNKAQLIAIVRFVDEDFIKEHYLFCKEVPERTTGEEIFRVKDDFFKICNIQWSNCIAVCTDGAAAMTGRKKVYSNYFSNESICKLNDFSISVYLIPSSSTAEWLRNIDEQK